MIFQAKTQVIFQAKTQAGIFLLNWPPGVFLWTAGKGAGSFVGGQLTEVLDITEVFFCTAIFGMFACSCVLVVKMAFGGKWERKVLDEKEIVMQQMNSINGKLDDVESRNDKGIQITRL